MCLLPLEIESSQCQATEDLIKKLRRVLYSPHFLFLDLAPLDRVDPLDLMEFLELREHGGCEQYLLDELPDLIVQQTDGHFADTVTLLERGLQTSWGLLYEELRSRL